MTNWEKDSVKILKKLTKSRKLLLNVFRSLPEDKWFDKNMVGEWSINDILLHIIGWDELLLKQAKLWIEGKDTVEGYDDIKEDEYNEEYIRTHSNKNKKEALEKFRKSTDILFEFLSNITENQKRYAIDNEFLVDLDLDWHDMEHYKELKAL